MAIPQKNATPPPALKDSVPLIKLTREQVDIEQWVERYLQGKLQPREKIALEAFCREHPKYLDEIQLGSRMHAGLRLMESAGRPEPWNEDKVHFWQTHWFAGAAAVLLLAALIALWRFNTQIDFFARKAATAEQRLADIPLNPAATSRTVRVTPVGRPSKQDGMFRINAGERAEFVTIQIDVARSSFDHFDIEIERVNQGRVAVLRNLRRNSNGFVTLSLNSSALGPGIYTATLSGLDWRGQAFPAGGYSFDIAPRR